MLFHPELLGKLLSVLMHIHPSRLKKESQCHAFN